jgi:hypothetical protein
MTRGRSERLAHEAIAQGVHGAMGAEAHGTDQMRDEVESGSQRRSSARPDHRAPSARPFCRIRRSRDLAEKTRNTTISDGAGTDRPEDLVKRRLEATAPNELE